MIKLGNVFILGDSYSSFCGYIPENYDFWYPNKNEEQTDVKKVEQTWWWQLLETTDSNLVRNSSWSGTTICNTCRPTLDIQTMMAFLKKKTLILFSFLVAPMILV